MEGIDIEDTKICTGCKKSLPNTSEYFNRNKSFKDGLETKCKKCMKEVKLRRYKNIIYELFCIKTNTYYIGQTIKPLNDRISKHFSDAKRGRKQPLYEDIRKYGREYFEYREIEHVEDVDQLDDRERYWIDTYIKNGYKLYNKEYGGRKNIQVPYDTRIEMAKSAGTKPFLVFDIEKKFVGRFEKIIDCNEKLNTFFNNSKIRNGNISNGYIAIYEKDFSEGLLENRINNIYVSKSGFVKKNKNYGGENNPMYNKGKHIIVYDENLNFVNEYYAMYKCVNDTKVNKYSINKYIDTDTPYKGFIFRTSPIV